MNRKSKARCPHGHLAEQVERPGVKGLSAFGCNASGTWVADVCPRECRIGGWFSSIYLPESAP